MPYLDFKEISERINFKDLLDKLGIAYQEEGEELRGKFDDGIDFIVNKKKNLFFCPKDRECRGSVINFTACHFATDLVGAAKQLTEHLFKPGKEPEREIPELELHYCPELRKMGISQELAKSFEVGLVKQRSVMAGKIAFLIKDRFNEKVGYIGLNKDGTWYFPKGFKQDYLYNQYRSQDEYLLLVANPLEVLKLKKDDIDAVALMGANMTQAQETLVKEYKFVTVSMKCPLNIVSRLVNGCYVKVIEPA